MSEPDFCVIDRGRDFDVLVVDTFACERGLSSSPWWAWCSHGTIGLHEWCEANERRRPRFTAAYLRRVRDTLRANEAPFADLQPC